MLTDQFLQLNRQVGVAKDPSQPIRDGATLHGCHRAGNVGDHREGQSPVIPDRQRSELEEPLRPGGRPRGDTAAARAGGIPQQGGDRAMVRVLSQHPTKNIGEHGRNMLTGGKGLKVTEIELTMRDAEIVQPAHGNAANRQSQQENAQGINVVSDTAFASARWMA